MRLNPEDDFGSIVVDLTAARLQPGAALLVEVARRRWVAPGSGWARSTAGASGAQPLLDPHVGAADRAGVHRAQRRNRDQDHLWTHQLNET
jgi:hypothetical protein